uniref:Ubiquitin carboxyl-terminal hydrolase n=1 Tax=Eptatretus burgeri TaxID=7764 RepID=A0A8C4PXM2_EPTBU
MILKLTLMKNQARENPFLWDNTNGNYFKKNMRNTKLQELCQNLGFAKNGIMFTEDDVKMKWKILRGSFVRELKKVETVGRISASGSGQMYASHSRWQHFDRLAFLRDYLRPRNSWSSDERFHQDSDGSPVATPETRPALRTCRRDSVMNPQFVQQLGVGTRWQFGDVLGLEPELLLMVPRPVVAALLLFPVSEKYETYRQEEEERLEADGYSPPKHLYFVKQTIENACGTIGLIHAIGNNKNIDFAENSALKLFLDSTVGMTPEERGRQLEKDTSIRASHESSAQEGQTEAPSLDKKVDLHFVAFVNVDGVLYELDGRKPFPIAHGNTSEDALLEDATAVFRQYMQRDPEELRFTVIALSAVS